MEEESDSRKCCCMDYTDTICNNRIDITGSRDNIKFEQRVFDISPSVALDYAATKIVCSYAQSATNRLPTD